MASWLAFCHSRCCSAKDDCEERDDASAPLPGVIVSVDSSPNMLKMTAAEVPIEEEVRICPISGMSTLEGICPFAKPRKKECVIKFEGIPGMNVDEAGRVGEVWQGTQAEKEQVQVGWTVKKVNDSDFRPAILHTVVASRAPFTITFEKNGVDAAKTKLKLRLDLEWESGNSEVSISVRPHLAEHWTTIGLPDTSSKEEIRRRYHDLAVQHHPDKHPEDPEGAKDRFQKIKEAYHALKEFDGELGFRWDDYPEKQQIMTGDEAIKVFAKFGLEACDHNHLKAIQLRHMVKCCSEVRALVFLQTPSEAEVEGTCAAAVQQCWVHGLCLDAKTGADHLVRIYRRDSNEAEDDGSSESEAE